jgi:hypothetical protein
MLSQDCRFARGELQQCPTRYFIFARVDGTGELQTVNYKLQTQHLDAHVQPSFMMPCFFIFSYVSSKVGFWGPPGTPASSNRSPMGVRPMVFQVHSSPEDYATAYPDGADTRYYLHTTTKKPLPTDTTFLQATSGFAGSGMSSVVLFVMGAIAGMVLKTAFDFHKEKNLHKGYATVPGYYHASASNSIDSNML